MMTKSKKLVISVVLLGCTILVMFAVIVCFLIPDQRIEGDWRDPEISISDVKTVALAESGTVVFSYFFNISQSADLRNPRYVNKGNAWQRRITERVHMIAVGFETVLVSTKNSVSPLPIENYVTEFRHEEDSLWLRSSRSHYNRAAIYVVGLKDLSVKELTTDDPVIRGMSFKPLKSNSIINILENYPQIKERLKAIYLLEPDSDNYYKQTRKPNRTDPGNA